MSYSILKEGSYYKLPIYNPNGEQTQEALSIKFPNTTLNQDGVKIEELLQVCMHYLESNNNGQPTDASDCVRDALFHLAK